jgi:hypothetical protein
LFDIVNHLINNDWNISHITLQRGHNIKTVICEFNQNVVFIDWWYRSQRGYRYIYPIKITTQSSIVSSLLSNNQIVNVEDKNKR